MKKIALAMLLAFSLTSLFGCGANKETSESANQKQEQTKQVLRVGLVPNQSPDEMRAKYDPFKKYLEQKLDMEIEFFVATNYAGVVEAMANDKLDLAYFGGLTYVQAKQKAKVHPIVTDVDSETKTTKYYSLVIAPANSPATSLADLKGKSFAFGDVSSTSGSLYPRIMLDQVGLKVPDDFSDVIYTGKHDATVMAVENGKVDAGGVEGRIFNKLVAEGKADKSKFKILAKSEPIEGYPWVMQDSMDKAVEQKVVDAFLSLDDKELLKLLKAERFETVQANDYAVIETEAARLGLLTPQK